MTCCDTISNSLLRYFDPFAGLPFDGRGKFKIGNRYWLQSAVESAQNLVRRDRNFMDAHADGVVDGVRHRGNDRQERTLAGFFGAVGSFRIVGLNQNRFDLGCLQSVVGLLYSKMDRILCEPFLRKICSSIKASPRAI